MGLVDSIRLINSLHGKEEHKELCTMLAQTFLVQNWIKPTDNESKQVFFSLCLLMLVLCSFITACYCQEVHESVIV